MKKLLLFLVLLFQINFLFSQLNILDEKNGFKDLKLGTHITDLNISQSEYIKDGELILYNTNDSDLKRVFDREMDQLFIFFRDRKLAGIILQKNFKSSYDFEEAIDEAKNLQNKFTEVLGKHNSAANDDFGIGPIWSAENVTLYVLYQMEDVKIQDDGTPLVVSNVRIMFLEKDEASSETLKDGF